MDGPRWSAPLNAAPPIVFMPATTADEQFTRCPQCATVFRVTAAQLAVREGQVRCGRCHRIFDATANLHAAAPANAAVDDSVAKATTGADAEEAEALAITAADTQNAETTAAPVDVGAQQDAPPEPAAAVALRPKGPGRSVLFAFAIPVLIGLLAAQAAFHFRDSIASHWPRTSPALTRMCEIVGCTLQPLHEIGYLSIEASDLQADPAHKGLLILSATVRNRAPYALAYPYLELTLTDAQDQPVVRRALAPKEYAGGTADLDAGVAANAELGVKLFIDASASSQVGYRLYLFYP